MGYTRRYIKKKKRQRLVISFSSFWYSSTFMPAKIRYERHGRLMKLRSNHVVPAWTFLYQLCTGSFFKKTNMSRYKDKERRYERKFPGYYQNHPCRLIFSLLTADMELKRLEEFLYFFYIVIHRWSSFFHLLATGRPTVTFSLCLFTSIG